MTLSAKHLYGMGLKGEMLGVFDSIETRNAPITEIFESTKGEKPVMLIDADKDRDTQIKEFVENIYKKQGSYGPFGDLMGLTLLSIIENSGAKEYLVLDYIGINGFLKPGCAADLGVFIRRIDKNNFEMVTGLKSDTGQYSHLFGGFQNCDGMTLDSSLYTALKEGKEEAGLKFGETDFEHLRRNYDLKEIKVSVKPDDDTTIECLLEKVATVQTSTSPSSLKSRYGKRVHVTTCYMLTIDVDDGTYQKVKNMFRAADDVAAIRFTDVSEAVVKNDFGKVPVFKDHHQTELTEMMISRLHRGYYGN